MASESPSDTRALFQRVYEREPEVLAHAPGRVNLIGEHVDYTGGLVLPCAIDRGTRVAAAHRADGIVRVSSAGRDSSVRFSAVAPEPAGDWSDYVRGVVRELAARGTPVAGAELAITSDLPEASGLSSSAALTVSSAAALDTLVAGGRSARELADLAHAAERDFVGVPCGILDPYAVALGRAGAALRIDCRDASVRIVPIDGPVALLVASSGVERRLADGGYPTRVAECTRALAGARASLGPGIRMLRDLLPEHLAELEAGLDPLAFRRARHVVSENARVDRFESALVAGALEEAGAILCEGQRSLRDDFDVSVAELDRLCALGDAAAGCYGSRLTGAGWGGCTLHLVDPAAVDSVIAEIQQGFEEHFGRRPPVLVTRPSDGVSTEGPPEV